MFCYNFLVFLYHLFNKFKFSWLQPLVLYQFYFRKQCELGTYVTFYYMNMDWLMVIGIEQKSESKQYEYSRHIFLFCRNKYR